MAGGQAIDLAAQGKRLSIEQVEDMHARKTGALIRASVLMAATCAPQLEMRFYEALAGFVGPIGLAFQIQDDLLDVLGQTSAIGKTAGADSERHKPTHPAILGVEASQERVRRLHAQALQRARALRSCGAAAAGARRVAAGTQFLRLFYPVTKRPGRAAAAARSRNARCGVRPAGSSPAAARQPSREPCPMKRSGIPRLSSGNAMPSRAQQLADRRARTARDRILLEGDQRLVARAQRAQQSSHRAVSRSAC